MLCAAGNVVGVNTLVRPELRGLGNYAIASSCVATVLDAIALGLAEDGDACRCIGYRIVLFNDRFNKRQRVESILMQEAGLSMDEAQAAMMRAHTTGRGIVRTFEVTRAASSGGGNDGDARSAAEAAEAMRALLASADLLVEVERVFE